MTSNILPMAWPWSPKKILEAVIIDSDFEWLIIDATHCKVHPYAAVSVGENQATKRTQKGSGFKDRPAVYAHGMPIKTVITKGIWLIAKKSYIESVHPMENAFIHLERWRGIAIRYAKRSLSFLATVQIRCIGLWINTIQRYSLKNFMVIQSIFNQLIL